MKKILKKVSFIAIFIITIVINTNFSNAFENPPSIAWRAGNYHITCPESKGSYVIEETLDTGISLMDPRISIAYTIIDSSYKSKITNEDINRVQDTLKELGEDYLLETLTGSKLYGYIDKFSTLKTIYTTYNEITNNLKNDTTNYALNIVMNRKVNLISKSKMADIAKYDYARTVLGNLMDSGHITVKMSKPWESTLRTEINCTNYAKSQIEKLRNDLKIIESKIIEKENSTISVSSVKLNKTSTTIVKGRTERLTATILPSNATNKNVTWSSNNTKVATVDTNGNVKAISTGTAKITAKSNNGKTSTCTVKVTNPYKIRTVKFTVNLPKSFKQKHYVEILDGNNNVIYTCKAKTGSSSYSFTYQLDTSSSSYTRRIRIRTVSGNKIYNSDLFKINSSTINKNVIATFASGTTTNSLKTGKITQK